MSFDDDFAALQPPAQATSLRAVLSFGLAASGAAIASFSASPVQAQVNFYTSGLTTSLANPTIYFSTTTGASSFTNFAAATDTLNFNGVGTEASVTSLGSDQVAEDPAKVPTCYAVLYTAGGSVNSSTSMVSGGTFTFDTSEGWTYPGQGYIGLDHSVASGYEYGYANIGLGANDSITLNSFALQQTPGIAIIVGSGSASAPEPDALALLALGAPGLAAMRLRRKVWAGASRIQSNPIG